MAIPSVETIKAAFSKLNVLQANQIAEVMATRSGRYETVEEALERINKILDGSGVEVIRGRSNRGGFRRDTVLAYVNMGDLYTSTVWYDVEKDRFGVGGWGAWVEKYKRRHGRLEGLSSSRRGSFMRVPGAGWR